MVNDPVTMQDVLQQFYPKYLEIYTPTADQAGAVRHILNCKTGAYGVNISRCTECGHIQFHNNSCRDRSCPMCQALSNELWIDAQNEHVLDIDYYHIVFTCPSELYSLIYCNQKELYALFFHAASETILELARDPRTWEGHRDLSASCIHGPPTSPTIRISMRFARAEDLTRTAAGIRKMGVIFSREKQSPDFSRGSSCPG